MPNILKIENLSCIRGEQVLFKNLNFTLLSGGALQIRGANGSGKTSLLKMIAGLAFINYGKVYWNGRSIDDVRENYFDSLNYIGHKLGFNENLTAEENLQYICNSYAAPMKRTIQNALEIINLSSKKKLLVRELSAGQKKRLALAKLLVLANPIWILDEPFSAIDKDGVSLMHQLMDEHLQANGMIIYTSHQESNLSHYKQEVILNG